MSLDIHWPAGPWAGKPTTSCSGRSAAWLMCPRRTSRRHAVEHRRRTPGECGAVPVFSILWWLGYSAGWMETIPNLYVYVDDALVHQHSLAGFQPDAGLSARRRTNFAVIALVFVWPGAQPAHRQQHWFCGRGRPDCVCHLGAIRLDWHHGRVYSVELLGRFYTGPRDWRASANAPRREGFACPACKVAPPAALSGVAANAGNPLTRLKRRVSVPTAEPNLPHRPARNAAACAR